MALSFVATVFLFVTPTLSLNSKIAIDVTTFSKFVPETEYTHDVDVVHLIGNDTIYVGLKFSLNPAGITKIMKGDRDEVNNALIKDNIEDICAMLHEPVDIITDYSIRSIIKSTVQKEIYNQVDDARKKYAEAGGSSSSTEDIMDEVGMDDAYFENFARELYSSANADGATVDTVTETLNIQIDDALDRARESGMVDDTGMTEEKEAQVKDNLVSILNSLNLVNEDGSLKKISEISYSYLASYLKDALTGKVDAAELEQKTGESTPSYMDRLIELFVYTQLPDMVYQIVGYVALGLFIGIFVFGAIWLLLFVITLIKTLTRKPWTMFGFWFWLIGPLQLILGLGLTVAFKFVLPAKIGPALAAFNLPIKTLILAPRTYCLVPSILFLAAIVIGIVYGVLKAIAKKQEKAL